MTFNRFTWWLYCHSRLYRRYLQGRDTTIHSRAYFDYRPN